MCNHVYVYIYIFYTYTLYIYTMELWESFHRFFQLNMTEIDSLQLLGTILTLLILCGADPILMFRNGWFNLVTLVVP